MNLPSVSKQEQASQALNQINPGWLFITTQFKIVLDQPSFKQTETISENLKKRVHSELKGVLCLESIFQINSMSVKHHQLKEHLLTV